MSETERLGMGHAANIGGMAAGEDQAPPARKTAPRRKVSAAAPDGAQVRTKQVAKPAGTTTPKATTRRKATEDQTATARPKTTARGKAADGQTATSKPKTTARRKTCLLYTSRCG